MKAFLIIIFLTIILNKLFSLKSKAQSGSSASNGVADTTRKNFMSDEEAHTIVRKLESFGFYKYTEEINIDTLKKEMATSLSQDGQLATVYDEKTFVPLDNRLFLLDGETLFEQDGFTDALTSMQLLFKKIDFKINIKNHIEEADITNHCLNHRITINGKEYIIFHNFKGYGWGEAAQRFAEIINDQLALQNKNERLYLINGANDGTAIFLNDEQFKLLDTLLTDNHWKPLKIDAWCKIFKVNPENYNKN